MVKASRGISAAAVNFLAVGVALPLILDYLAPLLTGYIALPPSSERWRYLLAFGSVFAATGFLQKGYAKGDFPWLFGKVGGGLTSIAFYYYLFLLLPSSLGSAGMETSGLILLVALAVALSYVYVVFDFADARRTRRSTEAERPAIETVSLG